MPINTRNRKDLKSYFVRNAIPTEKNFAELIEGQLNQADDGIFKFGDDPLSIVATRAEQRPVLRLYGEGSDQPPDWQFSLNPRGNPADPATARPGLGIVDGGGQTRLFLDRQTGRIGVGTTDPQGQLDVRVPDAHAESDRVVIEATSAWGDANTKHATIRGGPGGLLLANPRVPWDTTGQCASIRYGRANGTAGETWWDAGVRTDGSFSLIPYDKDADRKEKLKIGRQGEVTFGSGNSRLLIKAGLNSDPINLNAGPHVTIDCPENRLHITGSDALYVLNKQGMVIGKHWRGSGNLTVEGTLKIGIWTIEGNDTTLVFKCNNTIMKMIPTPQ